jgi:hypothetical protein
MKFVGLMAFATLFAVNSVMASDIIDIVDGSRAGCKTRTELETSQGKIFYRPVSFKRIDEVKGELALEFLNCVEKDGQIGFVAADPSIEQTVVMRPTPFQRSERKVKIERDHFSVVTFTERGHVLEKVSLKNSDGGLFRAVVRVDHADMDRTRNGNDTLQFNIHSIMKVTDAADGSVIDSGREVLGSFRLILK